MLFWWMVVVKMLLVMVVGEYWGYVYNVGRGEGATKFEQVRIRTDGGPDVGHFLIT